MEVKVDNNLDITQYEKVITSLNTNYLHLVQQTPLWLDTYNKSYIKNNKNLKILVLKFLEDEIYRGILLFQLRTKRTTRISYKKSLEIFGRGPTDFYQLLIEKEYECHVYSSFSKWLRLNILRWDELILSEIPETTINVSMLEESLIKRGFNVSITRSNGFYFVDTTKNWNDYYNDYIKNNNKDLLKDFRKLERNDIVLRLESHRSNIFEKLNDVLHLYAQRRETLGQNNTYDTKERKDFVMEILEAYENKGWVELTFLKDQNDNIWSFQLDWLYGGIRYHWNHAYNEDFKKFSPGKILLFLIMKRAFHDVKENQCNHMRGLSGYKSRLADQKGNLVSLKVNNPFSIRNKITKMYTKTTYLKGVIRNMFGTE